MSFPFKEIWQKRVIRNLNEATQAPWLDGIPDLDVDVAELGAGSASESNTIHIPLDSFEVDVLINNSSYPIAVQSYDDEAATVNLDKYQTKATSVTDDQIVGSSYDKIDNVTRSHTEAISKEKYGKAIHALAPNVESNDTPIALTTGGTGSRKKLTYQDLVAFKRQLDAVKVPRIGRRLVLTDEHLNDLLEDRDRFANLLSDMNKGTIAPMIAGFKTYSYQKMPLLFKDTNSSNKWTKRPYGTVAVNGDQEASVCFVETNVAKKTGLTKQYFSPASTDPTSQRNLLNYRHYFIAVPVRSKFMGAIVSGS